MINGMSNNMAQKLQSRQRIELLHDIYTVILELTRQCDKIADSRVAWKGAKARSNSYKSFGLPPAYG